MMQTIDKLGSDSFFSIPVLPAVNIVELFFGAVVVCMIISEMDESITEYIELTGQVHHDGNAENIVAEVCQTDCAGRDFLPHQSEPE